MKPFLALVCIVLVCVTWYFAFTAWQESGRQKANTQPSDTLTRKELDKILHQLDVAGEESAMSSHAMNEAAKYIREQHARLENLDGRVRGLEERVFYLESHPPTAEQK